MRLSADHVKETVAGYYGLQLREFESSRSRSRRIIWPRHVAVFLSREMCGSSLPSLSRRFYRNHNSLLHAIRVVEKAAADPRRRHELEDLREKLNTIAGRDVRELFIQELGATIAVCAWLASIGARRR